jgi:F-type H+-transporting ATPase subunit delta
LQNLRIARRYGKAFVLAAAEAGAISVVRAQVDELLALLSGSPEFAAFLAEPMIPPATKRAALAEVFGERLHPLVQGLLNLLVERRRERELQTVLEEATRLANEREGIEAAHVRSFLPLLAEQRDALASALNRMSGKRIRLHTETDASLAGGFVVEMSDRTYDGSLRAQLERARRAIAGR